MKRSDVYDSIKEIFRDVFDDDSVEPHDGMTAAEVSSWDSLSNIRMIVAVEEHFKIQFSTIEISDLPNVGALVDTIERKLQK
jgi:acyl carrier protein